MSCDEIVWYQRLLKVLHEETDAAVHAWINDSFDGFRCQLTPDSISLAHQIDYAH